MPKILVVDDSKAVHAFITSLLQERSLVGDHVYSGEEALAHFRRDPRSDLIILDWEMPGLTGPETAHSLRNSGYKGPILMITTRNHPSDIQHALDQGVDEFMMKPFTGDILFSKIDSLWGAA